MAVKRDARREAEFQRIIREDQEHDRALAANDAAFVKIINQEIGENYALYLGDCVAVARGLPDNSVHMSISSLPFGSLYSYTDSLNDFSNVRSDEEFWTGMDFLIREMMRVMMPGRLVSMHCMNLPKSKERDGVIAIKDFRGELIRHFEKAGFFYHSEVCIWKDPLIAATRTHALGLAHKQIVEDSARCRVGIPDYLCTFGKPGDNPEPVSHKPSGLTRYIGKREDEPKAERRDNPKTNKYSHFVWQRYASPIWMDIDPGDTLQFESAREDEDSRHICPLQLTVIRRAVELWSNPGDIVWSPFAGIGSEGYVAIQEGRRFIGSELKESYWRNACANLRYAQDHFQPSLFSAAASDTPAYLVAMGDNDARMEADLEPQA
jgi:DNA modification methylase